MNQPNKTDNYCELYSGTHFYILNPNPNDIHLSDIAHSLSLNTRFNGHCSQFFSIAQHCVLAANLAFERKLSLMYQLSALFHDSSECFISDIASPIKECFINYKEIENRIMSVIYSKFNINILWNDPLIKQIDLDLLTSEAYYLMPSKGLDWSTRTNTIISIKEFWNPKRAEKEFYNLAIFLIAEIQKKGGRNLI